MPAPMLAAVGDLTDLPRLCQDDRYELSQKVDGRRLLVQLSGGVIRGFNRRGERTDVPRAVAARLALCPIDVVMDGELIGPTWHVFDLPEAHNAVTPQTPLRVRRTALETLVSTCSLESPALRLLPAATTTDDKTRLSQRVIEAGAEGLMAKDLEGAYLYGKRGSAMRKLKLTKTVDAVVIGFSAHGHDSLSLGLYDDAGDLVPIGEVTRQAGDGRLAKAGSVVEVTYLTFSGTRLIQPTRPLLRSDKQPDECHWDQLSVGHTRAIVPL